MDSARYAALFQSEAREHLDEVDRALLAIEQTSASAEAGDHFATLFRSMHTIKGMAGAMGYSVVERLAHALESRCEPLRSSREDVSESVLRTLFDGIDILRTEIDRLATHGATPDPDAASERESTERQLASFMARLEADIAQKAPASADSSDIVEVRNKDAAVSSASAPAGTRAVRVRLLDDCPLKGVRALIVLAKLHMIGKVIETDPPQSSWQADSFDGAFTASVSTAVDDESIASAVKSAGEVKSVTVAASGVKPAGTSRAARTVRLDAYRLDSLLGLSGELVIARDRMQRAVEAMSKPDRDVMLAFREMARLVNAMQDEVLQTRLHPASHVFNRFPRLVRDIAHELGKEVRFSMEGSTIELDRALLDSLGDPLLHLLRNALDHGLENPAQRAAAGKPTEGELILRAARDRGQVVIQVQDDGRGIDRHAVLNRAREKGLVGDHVDSLSDDELLSLISHSGFSTAGSVSRLSGRGVGIDVVTVRIRALGGRVELETIEGVGTVFTLRLPAQLGMSRSLLVEAGGRVYAIPAVNIEEVLALNDQIDESGCVTVRDRNVFAVALAEHFGHASDEPGRQSERHLVIVGAGGQSAAIIVDSLVGHQDIIVRPLDIVRGALPLFSGATVLGDGTPCLIVDVLSILSSAIRNGSTIMKSVSQRVDTVVGAR